VSRGPEEGIVTALEQLKQLAESLATPEALAESFCELDDDDQAKFFVAVAKLMSTWPQPAAAFQQAFFIGEHLRTCACSTEEARSFVRGVYNAMASEQPCCVCRVMTRTDLLEDVSDHDSLLTDACPICTEALDEERREEEARTDFDLTVVEVRS
jgi:hypothetical protein